MSRYSRRISVAEVMRTGAGAARLFTGLTVRTARRQAATEQTTLVNYKKIVLPLRWGTMSFFKLIIICSDLAIDNYKLRNMLVSYKK